MSRTVRHHQTSVTRGALRAPAGAVVVAVVVLGILVPALANAYWLNAFIGATIYAIVALAVGVLYGRLGIVSLCQVGLLGVGAWITLRLGFAAHLPFVVLTLAAGVGTAIIGLLFLSPALRFNAMYIALISLMAAAALEVFFTAAGFPNGGGGLEGRVPVDQAPHALARPQLATSDAGFLRYSLVVAVIVFVAAWLLLRARPGRSWAAIRRSEASASSVGIGVAGYKVTAILLASFATGIAGALLAASIGTMDVSLVPASQSIVVFAVVLVAGAFSLGGAVIAAALAQLLPALLTKLGVSGDWALVVFGVGLVVSLLDSPGGIAGQLSAVSRRVAVRSPRMEAQNAGD